MATPSKNKQLADLYNSLGQLSKSFQTAAASLDVESTKFVDAITRTSDAFKKVVGGKFLSPLVSASKSIADAFQNATNNLNQGGAGGGGGGGGGGNTTDPDQDAYFRLSNLKMFTDALVTATESAYDAVYSFNLLGISLGPAIDLLSVHKNLIGQVNASILNIPQQFEALQQKLLGMGTSIPKFESSFAEELNGLIGDKLQNVANAADLLNQGVRGNFKGLLQVAAKMDLTGQKTSMLTNDFIKFSVAMQSNSSQMNNMAMALQYNAESYNVKTEDLIKVIGSIKNIEVMGALGFGPKFSQNLTSLAAEFKIGQDQITALINSLTTPETFAKIAAVDPTLAGLVSQLEQSTGPEQFKSVFQEIVGKLGTFAQGLAGQAGGAGLPSTVVGSQLFSMFGPAILQASQLLQVFNGQMTEQQKLAQTELDINQSFNAVVLELKNQFTPLLQAVIDFSKGILDGKGSLLIWGGVIIKGVTTLAGLYNQFKQAEGALRSFSRSLDAAAAKANKENPAGMGSQFLNIFSKLGGSAFGKIAGSLIKFAGPLGLAYGAITTAVDVYDYFSSKKEDATKQQTQATQKNTNQIAALTQAQQNQTSQAQRMSSRDSIYAGMNRALQSAVTGDRVFIEMLAELKKNGQITATKLDAIVSRQTDAIVNQIVRGQP